MMTSSTTFLANPRSNEMESECFELYYVAAKSDSEAKRVVEDLANYNTFIHFSKKCRTFFS